MMDNETIVDQIVRSLSFEVVAVPQNVQVDNMSKSTPLNFKIRVRKKHDAGLRHGVLSMPKVDTKSDNGKDDAPQRIRLVSSDQTVMSFDVLMEADFDKVPLKHGKQNVNMISPGLDVNNEEDNRPPLSKNADKLTTSPIFSKRNKDFFGRCKPGGCLDPPYGEDKYSYQPTQQNLSLPVKDDPNKLKSSSIFKNKIFKRKKKDSQDEDIIKSFSKKPTEDDSILSLYETGSLQTSIAYSNSIITYPHPSNSGELLTEEKKPNRKEEKLNKKRNSNENKSRSLVIEDAGSYFILPKKTRNRSNHSDAKIMKLNDNFNDNLIKSKIKNDLNTTTEPDDSLKEKPSEKYERNYSSTASNLISIPLLVPLKAVKKDPIYNLEKVTIDEKFYISPLIENTTSSTKNKAKAEIKTNNQTEILLESENNDSINSDDFTTPFLEQDTSVLDGAKISDETLFSKTESKLPKIKPLHYVYDIPDISYTIEQKNYDVGEESSPVMLKNISPQSTQKNMFSGDRKRLSIDDFDENQVNSSKLNVSSRRENDENDKIDVNQNRLPTTNPNLISANKPSIDSVMKENCNNLNLYTDEMDIKSHPLVTTKEKSILDITTNFSEQVRETSSENVNVILKLPVNPENIKTVSFSTDDLKHIWKNETEPLKSMPDFITKTLLSETELNQEHQKLENNSLPSTQNLENSLNKQVSEILHEAIPILEAEIKKISFSDILMSENEKGEVTNAGLIDDLEKILLVNAIDDYKSPETLNIKNFEENFTNNTKKIFTKPDETNMLSKSNLNEDVSLEIKDGRQLPNSKNKIFKQPRNDTQSTTINEKENDFDNFNNNNKKTETKEILENKSITRLTGDEINKKKSVVFKNEESASAQRVSEYEEERSLKHTVVTDTPNNQEYKYSNSNLDNITEQLKYSHEMESVFDNNKNEFMTEQAPNLFSDIVKSEIKTQYKSIYNAENQIFSNENSVFYDPLQPTKKLSKDKVPWKMDMALQSYIDENNERVIKSFDSRSVPQRHHNDTILVAQCSLDNKSNEIKIPIDQKNELSLQIKSNKSRILPHKDSDENCFTADQPYTKNKIKIDIMTEEKGSDIPTADIDVNKPELKKSNKVISYDVRDDLNRIYEQELLPLHDIIKELREEIDMLVAFQMRFKQKVEKLVRKRSRPLRLVYPGKKCACVRRI